MWKISLRFAITLGHLFRTFYHFGLILMRKVCKCGLCINLNLDWHLYLIQKIIPRSILTSANSKNSNIYRAQLTVKLQ